MYDPLLLEIVVAGTDVVPGDNLDIRSDAFAYSTTEMKRALNSFILA
jgi:hypothetical protein